MRTFEWVERLLKGRQDIQTRKAAMIEAIRFGAISIVDKLLDFEISDSRLLLEGSSELTAAIEECCRYGHIGVLHRLLDWNSKCGSSDVLWLGASIYTAVSKNNIDMVNKLMEAGADVNAMTSDYQTALLAAIQKRDKILVEKFIKAGAALNLEGSSCSDILEHRRLSGAVLVTATAHGDPADDSILEVLIEAGADINAPGSANLGEAWTCSCQTPLTAAISWRGPRWVERLILKGAALNNPLESHLCRTPLAAAVHRGSVPLVQFLLRKGANPEDAQALEAATDNIEILKLLLATLGIRKELRDNCNLGRHAIEKAIRNHDIAVISILLGSQLVDLNSVAVGSTWSVLYKALIHDRGPGFEIIRMFLSSGADPSSIVWKSKYETRSALLVAIKACDQAVLQLLLEAGANPELTFVPGMLLSPLQVAVIEQDQVAVQSLLHYGANPDAASPCGKYGTPVQEATKCKNLEMVRLLLSSRADPNTVADNMPNTALQIAARDGCKEIVDILLEHGSDVNSLPAENSGATALQFASIGGFLGIACLLLENGADVNAPGAPVGGRTALEGAAEHGRIDMVQLLLNAGANVFEAGQEQYERAVGLASKNGHHATRQLLESYHA